MIATFQTIIKECLKLNTVILANYSVNKDTLALLSVAHPDYHTIAIETDRKLYIRKTPFQIIKAACLKGGSTYEGRRAAVTYLTGAKHKVPIPINPTEHIYAFPTYSPTQFECSWIFHDHVHSISPYQKNHTVITFKNELQLKLPVSYYTIEKQMYRTAQCIIRFTHFTNEKTFCMPRSTPELIHY
ncbi:competence protein ComK [Anaerobacillus sp. CMMVII]|nr:competence protein ComK [Anaerobacillus sp. CMMVII]